MKIFITGATGYIGINLCMKLVEEGHTVHALCRSEAKAKLIKHQNIKIFYGGILDQDSMEAGMEGCDSAFHLAAYARVWSKDPGTFDKINIDGTTKFIKAARKCMVKKLVITSTAGVYGPSIDDNIVDETAQRAVGFFNEYERTKSIADDKTLEYVKAGMDIVLVHPTRVFGPGLLSESNAVTTMVSQYIKGKWHLLPGNGKSIGNYVFVDDVVNGHLLSMEKGKAGEKYILGGQNLSYIEFFNQLRLVSGKIYRLYKFPYFLMLALSEIMLILAKVFGITPLITPGFVRRYNYNWKNTSRKAEARLGYQITPIEIALKKTVDWINADK